MKNSKLLILSLLVIGATAFAVTPVFARGGGGGNSAGRGNGPGQGMSRGDPATCTLSGPGQGTPRRDGSGKAQAQRGNPNSKGTPLKDGSGKATAPGKGPKDGSGNNPNCPNPPKS